MLRVEYDQPDAHRLTLVAARPASEWLRRFAVTAVALAMAGASVFAVLEVPELTVFAPFVLAACVGLAGIQPEELWKIEIRSGVLRMEVRGGWIWGRRTVRLDTSSRAGPNIEASDFGPAGPDAAELGLCISVHGRDLPLCSVERLERIDEVEMLTHRIAAALSMGAEMRTTRQGAVGAIGPGLPAPPAPAKITTGYRTAARRPGMDLSAKPTYRPPEPPAKSLDDSHRGSLRTRLVRADGWRIRGGRPYGFFVLVLVVAAALYGFGTSGVHRQVDEMAALLGCVFAGLVFFWVAGPRVGRAVMLPLLWIGGSRRLAFPPSPQLALFAGGALPDAGGVQVRRGFVLRDCEDDAMVYLVRRVPWDRRSRRGSRSEAWIRSGGRWSLLAQGRHGDGSDHAVVHAIAHEAGRRLDRPVRSGVQ